MNIEDILEVLKYRKDITGIAMRGGRSVETTESE